MRSMRLTVVAALAVFALATAGCGGDDEATDDTTTTDTVTETTTDETGPIIRMALQGTVGPGFDISLSTEDGELTTLMPGTYELRVEDLSDIHNFHLTGPGGVDVSTDVAGEGTESFPITLEPGTYEFVCDPHAGQMNGSFEVSG
jgi:plastocyanin